ncbi:MAG: hypothetical protein IH606_07135 [Burkholderiales bacterium]|nr:hypothetical protein [Burkholderiales bacterium]
MDRHLQLEKLIREHFAGQNDWAASAIHKISGRSVSRRTVQAWLLRPDRPSSRNCPDWAYDALLGAISDPDCWKPGPRHSSLEAYSDDPFTKADEFADKYSVMYAAGEIEQEKQLRQKWESANVAGLPQMLFEFQRSIEKKIDEQYRLIDALIAGIKGSTDYSSLRDLVDKQLRADEIIRHEIRLVRSDMENATGELSSDQENSSPDPSPTQ